MFEPTMSLFIKDSIGAKSALNFDISNACAGMITGAFILDNLIKSRCVKNGMVVSGECITPLTDTAIKEIDNPYDDQFASLTVGDAGAAFILDGSPNTDEGIDFIDFATIADFAKLCIGGPSDLSPGYFMTTKSRELHNEAISRYPMMLEKSFSKFGLSFRPEEYEFIIPHQTSVRAIQTFIKEGAKYFNVEMPAELSSVVEYGNTATTTHSLVLYNGLKENKIKQGDRVLLSVIASGIVIGCLSMKLGNLEIKSCIHE